MAVCYDFWIVLINNCANVFVNDYGRNRILQSDLLESFYKVKISDTGNDL